MRLKAKNFDMSLFVVAALAIGLVIGAIINSIPKTFAEDQDVTKSQQDYHFVYIFDSDRKLTIKTNALTVKEALSRVNIIVDEYDIVEPTLDSVIDANNFYINIHRSRPVLVVNGSNKTIIHTASYDSETIAKAAGYNLNSGDTVTFSPGDKFLETGVTSVYTINHSVYSNIANVGDVDINIASTYTPIANISMQKLTKSKGRNRYTVTKPNGETILRQETYYDLPMSKVMSYRLRDGCGDGTYSVRDDGVKIDYEGFVLVAANLDIYPLCSIVETSLGLGKVYDTGAFAEVNPEQFDIATDWTNRNGN